MNILLETWELYGLTTSLSSQTTQYEKLQPMLGKYALTLLPTHNMEKRKTILIVACLPELVWGRLVQSCGLIFFSDALIKSMRA